jgi:peptide/nickel transport system permease protein
MAQYLVRRALLTIPVLIGVSTITFFLLYLVPGDPVDLILGDRASDGDRDVLRRNLGLDQPIADQYLKFISDLLQGDLGRSIFSSRPVLEEIAARFPATLELTAGAILLSILIGIPLGVLTAVRHNSVFDQALLVVSLFGISIPGFLLGPLLIWIFAIQLNLFPVSERGGLEHLFLPALSLALPLGSILMRVTRAAILEVINEEYITVARSKGLAPRTLYFKHALSNAMIPILTTVGLQIGALLTGTVITETIFDWPGLGTLLFGAIQKRDYPLVQGCILTVATIYVLVNLFTDILYGVANPKVRLGQEG